MPRDRACLAIGAVAFLVSCLAAAWPATADTAAQLSASLPAAAVAAPDTSPPVERQVSSFVKGVIKEIRWSFRMLRWMFWRALDWWGGWIKRGAFSIAIAIVAALADGGLVNAWRAEGLRTLATYSALMLYVYGRLLFSAGVNLAPKLLLAGALIYGFVRRDLVPDASFIPGRVEDIVLIVIATRAFVYSCPEELVNQYAQRAVGLKRRVLAPQRAREH
jgi:hypothetical protein